MTPDRDPVAVREAREVIAVRSLGETRGAAFVEGRGLGVVIRPPSRPHGPGTWRQHFHRWTAEVVTSSARGLVEPSRTVLRVTDDPRTMRERMLAGDPYLADDPELIEAHAVAMDLIAAYSATTPREEQLRRTLLERLLGSVGEDTTIRPPLFVDYGAQITIGARCFANFGLVALDVAPIAIGDDVQIGPNVQLLTPTHTVEPGPRLDKWEAARPITIEDNVWLGGGVIVLPGVTIGEHTVVGAGSVVTKDLPANVVALGNPARVVRTIEVSTTRDPEM